MYLTYEIDTDQLYSVMTRFDNFIQYSKGKKDVTLVISSYGGDVYAKLGTIDYFNSLPVKVNTDLLNDIIQNDFIPIVTPMGLDQKGQAYNINADTAAGALARSLKSRRLLLATDVEGVLDKNEKLISEIKSLEAEKLINDQTIHGGMIPKIKTCIEAVNNGVRGVVIIDGRKPHSILFELFSDLGAGTLIRK